MQYSLIPSLQRSPDTAKDISPSTKASPQSSGMKRQHQESESDEKKKGTQIISFIYASFDANIFQLLVSLVLLSGV